MVRRPLEGTDDPERWRDERAGVTRVNRRTRGPEYESPPRISSTALAFLGVEVIPPFTPAGPTQQFRFKAASAGTAVVHFRRLLGDSVVSFVEDSVRIR